MVTDQLWPGGWGLWDISRNRTLVFVTGFAEGVPQLASIDLLTSRSRVLGELPARPTTLRNGRLAVSPDGTRVLVDLVEPEERDIHFRDALD